MSEVSDISSEKEVRRDDVQKLFREGRLLVRVVDTPTLQKDVKGVVLDNTPWEEELDLMSREGGMGHMSTTLILPERKIPLYKKPYGFIFDSDKVMVEHVSREDSGSMTDKNGELVANTTDIKNIGELKDLYKDASGSQSMNEVNVTAKKEAVVGLVIRAGVMEPSTLLGLEISRRYLAQKGMELPVYEYDERVGSIRNFFVPQANELLSKMSPARRRFYEERLK